MSASVRPAGSDRRAAALALSLLLAACASVQPPRPQPAPAAGAGARECTRWFETLDARIDAAGVRDAQASPVPGFPHLRSTRFLAARVPEPAADDAAWRAWLSALRAADQSARAHELRNLDAATAAADTDAAQRCGQALLEADPGDAGARATLRARVRVPDAYLEWQRVVGLYPLARIPIERGVVRWQDGAREAFARPPGAGPGDPPLRRYAPPAAASLTRPEVAAVLDRAARHPLGIAEPDAATQARLFATYAPVYEIETAGPHDLPGAPRWSGAPHPVVDTQQPVVYRRLEHTRYRGRTLVQLVYTLWFAERPAEHAFDLYAGKLDGLVWRVTLAPDGEPVMFDTMHPCGCYHMFLPPGPAEALPAPDPDDEWAFVPARLPRIVEGQRVRLRLAARTHFLTDARVDEGPSADARRYAFDDEDALRSLPQPGGGWRSLYGPDGLVPGTGRPEQLLFWPMGVASAGAMRQWGHHATAFLGRRHFDDADLIERRFRLALP